MLAVIVGPCTYLKFRHRNTDHIILLTNTTIALNEVALSYNKVRGLYFLAVVSAANIIVYSTAVLNITNAFSVVSPFQAHIISTWNTLIKIILACK